MKKLIIFGSLLLLGSCAKLDYSVQQEVREEKLCTYIWKYNRLLGENDIVYYRFDTLNLATFDSVQQLRLRQADSLLVRFEKLK